MDPEWHLEINGTSDDHLHPTVQLTMLVTKTTYHQPKIHPTGQNQHLPQQSAVLQYPQPWISINP